MAKDIIGELNKKDLSEFNKDFIGLIRVYTGIADEYSRSGKDTDKYLDKLKQIVQLFNKKYSGISASLSKTPEELRLRLLIKEKTIVDVLKNAASKIDGLKSIGATSPGKAVVEEADKFSKEIEGIKDKLYISYYQQETGSSTVFLEQNGEGSIELHYGEDITSDKSPEFKICAYYAVKDGIGQEDVHELLDSIGFLETPNLAKVRKLFSKFSTRIGG